MKSPRSSLHFIHIHTPSSTTMTSAPQDIPGASTTTTRNRANTFSYPRWDANGNSHHPPPDVSLSRTLSRSQGVGGNATSTPASPPSSSTASGSTPSSILRLLGLSSPKAGPSLPPVHGNTGGDERATTTTAGDNNHNSRRRAGHNRGASYSGPPSASTSSSFYSSNPGNSSPFYEDDEDGPPEAITPPQHHILPSPATATGPGGGGIGGPTNYGHELDESHKLELDDVFDADSRVTLSNNAGYSKTGSGGGSNALAASQPLGRRSSWSPAAKGGYDASGPYSSSPPAGIKSWLNGQSAATTTYPISAQAHNNNGQSVTSSSNNITDYGSSPVGLFRRLSLSVNRRVSSGRPHK